MPPFASMPLTLCFIRGVMLLRVMHPCAAQKTTGLLVTLEENPKWDLLREVLEEVATDADTSGLSGVRPAPPAATRGAEGEGAGEGEPGAGCASEAPTAPAAADVEAPEPVMADAGAVVLVVARDDKTCRVLHEYVSRDQKAVLQRELKW